MRTTETSMGTHGTGATRSAGCGHRCLPPWRLYCVAAWHTAHCRDVALARARPAVVHERSDSSDRRTVLRQQQKWEEMGGNGSTATGPPPPPHPMRVTRPRRFLSLPHSLPRSSPHCALRTTTLPPARTRTHTHTRTRTYASTHARTTARTHTHVRTHAWTHARTHARSATDRKPSQRLSHLKVAAVVKDMHVDSHVPDLR